MPCWIDDEEVEELMGDVIEFAAICRERMREPRSLDEVEDVCPVAWLPAPRGRPLFLPEWLAAVTDLVALDTEARLRGYDGFELYDAAAM